MTEREQLAATARAAGLALTTKELADLLPAWRRYLGLVEQLRAATTTQDWDERG